MISQTLMIKLGLYTLLALGLLWAGKQWLNRHDNKVAQQTREEVTEEQRAKAEAGFAAERKALLADREVLSARIAELDKQNTRLHGALDETIKLSKKLQAAGISAAAGVPDSELNGAIRAVLAGSQPAAVR